MYTALQIAAYIMSEQPRIDEMRLHKYLYLAQRESFIVSGKPLFEDAFEAWKFGPVIPEVRHAYHSKSLNEYFADSYDEKTIKVIEDTIARYKRFSSWGLSRITHNEVSWRNARRGLQDGENGNNPMHVEDIKIDADAESRQRNWDLLEEVLSRGE